MSSTELGQRVDHGEYTLADLDQELLLEVAQDSIREGLRSGQPPAVDPRWFPCELRELRATFVTLRIENELRGCIGTVKALRPLVVDVADNAFDAAFGDPRFPPVQKSEFPLLETQISILSRLESMVVHGEAELLAQLRPGIDGLELECGLQRGLFLPSVWEQLPDPRVFLTQLKLKAGLPPKTWSDRTRVRRFTTTSIHREATARGYPRN